MQTITAEPYTAVPLNIVPQQDGSDLAHIINKVSTIVSKCAAHRSLFTDYIRGCEGACDGICRDLTPTCALAKRAITSAISRPNAITWEVWKDGIDLAGILMLTDVVVGCDAKAHYFFFDSKLSGKEDLLNAWKEWAFSDHEGWRALNRVTIEVPADVFAFARHASKHLGFGGPFEFKCKNFRLPVEGIKRDCLLRNGEFQDVLVMGCLNG